MNDSLVINKPSLLQALDLLRPALASKEIQENSTSFSFLGDRIVTYNGFLSVCVPFQTGITGAVKADEFYKILNKIKADELTLTVVGNEIQIQSGKTRAGLRIDSKTLQAQEPENEFLELPQGFFEALNFCQFSASRDMTRPHLTCIHIQGQFITSSDNYRITETWMSKSSPYDFLLPAMAVQYLPRYNLTHMALDHSWAHFLDEQTGVLFSCLLKAGKLMDVASFFEVEGTTIRLPAELQDALERTKIMVEGDSALDLRITLRLESGRLICRGEKSIGWIEEILDLDYQGDQVDIIANPLFLAEILGRTQEMMVSQKVCMFWGENFRHLMLLAVS